MSGNPTHVVVAVQRAKDLISKGKNGTNDAFVTIALADKKFQTTIKDKVIDPEWYEECDVPLPENYNEHKLTLQVCHRNNLGIDEFLGHLEVPLQNFDVYDPPKPIWYSLLCKPGQNKTKPRGELEVRMAFEVKKVKDFDEMSTTSSASRRFKMSKKSIKHAASAIGKKIKGPKAEKTSDFIGVPDLTGLDSGALGMDDIAENYATSVIVPKKRLSMNSDSLSLPPSSPAFQRGSPYSSRGYSPYNRRPSREEKATPPSSNASTEDVKQKADDADSVDALFHRTHKRGGSGSDVLNTKPNRRLLTSKTKSSSTIDISSAAGSEFDAVDRTQGLLDDAAAKSRLRSATSASQLSSEALPEVEEDKEEKSPSSRRVSVAVASKVVDEPVLVDDDSDDSMEEYKPSPIGPLFKHSEPADLFTRMAAQMEQEQEDDFPVTKHQAESGEEIFSYVPDLDKSETKAVHSTPISDGASFDVTPKNKKKGKGKEKVITPASDIFNLLMASDEPEYAVDDTLPPNSKLVLPEDDTNPFSEETDQRSDIDELKHSESEQMNNPFDSTQADSKADASKVSDSNPFEEVSKTDEAEPEAASTIVGGSLMSVNKGDNSFKSPSPANAPLATSCNPFDDPDDKPAAAEISSNPFEDAEEIPKADISSNPFEDDTVDEKSQNPFEESAKSENPFEDSVRSENPFEDSVRSENPFEDSVGSENVSKNPFDDVEDTPGSNPFDDEGDEEQPSSFNRVGSFARNGSSRFSGNKRRKKRESKKIAAPLPPKPQNTSADAQPRSDSPIIAAGSPADSPRHRSKKDKKAPRAPTIITPTVDTARDRSGSYNPPGASNYSSADKRRDTDTGRMESHISDIELKQKNSATASSSDNLHAQGKSERQPAVGAEAPDVPYEPRMTRELGVQVSLEVQQDKSLAPEFRSKTKQELVDIIKKLRVQVRKGEDHAKDLEEYIDSLLLRVMSTDPNLLITQASCSKQAQHANRLSS